MKNQATLQSSPSTMKAQPIKRALISVSDKSGLKELAFFLNKSGVDILSTGGTAKLLKEAGCQVTEISEHTGFPEIMDGRVKTLHPKVHGGLLGRRDLTTHTDAMEQHDIAPIDLVIVNLYPFEETVKSGADAETVIENIDIGGPSMVRSAAKNHEFVTIITDAADYEKLQSEMTTNGGTSLEFRKYCAAKAYARTAAYDSAISQWFAKEQGVDFPQTLTIAATLKQPLRYGENPHQKAAFYQTDSRFGLAAAQQLQGKELSYNNINDTDAALQMVLDFKEPAAVIVKHANPCGIALADTIEDAFAKALACDPVSAFGGIMAFNRPITAKLAEHIATMFVEVIIAPVVEPAAKAVFEKKKNLRVLEAPNMLKAEQGARQYKSVMGGLLVQDADFETISEAELQVVTKREPTQEELKDLLFGFRVCKHVKSNAIVFAKNQATVGIGAGQMSRVDSVRIASLKASDDKENPARAKGGIVASDAFFPFADGLLQAAESGVTAAIQPGGSVRDDEVIAAANEHNIAMVFTGKRHFRH